MRAPGLLVLLSILAGCGSDPKITAVRVLASFGDPRFDQLEFLLAIDGAPAGIFTAPVPAKGLLPSPQDLVFYGPDAWAGKTATCQVRGLRSTDGVASSLPTSVLVELHRVVTCAVILEDTMDGSVLDGAMLAFDAGTGGDFLTALPDGGQPTDTLPPDGRAADAPPPGVDVPPPADAPLPPDTAPPPDADGALDLPWPVDLPPDLSPPPPDAPTPITGCAANAARTAFLDRAQFPDVAACGAPIAYSAAIGAAGGVCASGWHWCRAEEVGSLPAAEPGSVSGSTCGWVDGTQGTCPDRRSSYGQAACAGAATRNLSVGGPTSAALPCTGVDLGCSEPWKLAIAFDHWGTSSVTRMSGGCLEHLGFQCTASTGGASCWITCCRN